MPFLPRKATPIQPDVQPTIERIESFRCKENISILALAKAAKTNQPSLARFLGGERKTVTSCARLVLRHIENLDKQHNWHSRDSIPEGVEKAVRDIWDGNQQSADFLATLIRALKPALDVAAQSQVANNVGRTR